MPADDSPHAGQPFLAAGADLKEASAAMILLHGRGAAADDILSLSLHLDYAGLSFLAPQAAGYTWYPNRFLAPVEQNEPHLSSALALIGELVKHIETHRIPSERIFLGGFSQGACLACEYLIRNPRRYAGLLVFSGGYIGPSNGPRQPTGELVDMPVFLGCSDPDPHIPLTRVEETAGLLLAMGANVTVKLYPDMGHTINGDEIEAARDIVVKSLRSSEV